MMKKIVCGLLLVLVMTGSAFAQSPIARFVYEEAEEAYAKQDYSTTLIKLEKAEKEFGKINPPILYLRIMARHGLLKANPTDFGTVERLRAETAQYLKEYGNLESVQDKAREVYRVSAELEQYPASLAEYEAKLQAEEARRRAEAAEAKQRMEEARKACPACFPEMVAIPGKNYEIGKYEVTQAEWQSIMGNNPSKFKNCGGNCPVDSVNWNDIQEFLTKLNQKTGKQYRLPTESEWASACYGGRQTEYCGGNDADAVAWYGGFFGGNSGYSTHPVGQKQANGYGLYDMSGNVWEWTEGCWDSTCSSRVLRGGSWYDVVPAFVRASNPDRLFLPAERSNNYGFRLAAPAP